MLLETDHYLNSRVTISFVLNTQGGVSEFHIMITFFCISLLCYYLGSNNELKHFNFSFSSIFKKREPFQSQEQSSTLLKWQVHWDTCTLSTLFTGLFRGSFQGADS